MVWLFFSSSVRDPVMLRHHSFFLGIKVVSHVRFVFTYTRTQAALEAVALPFFLSQLAAALKISRHNNFLRHHHKHFQGNLSRKNKTKQQQKNQEKNNNKQTAQRSHRDRREMKNERRYLQMLRAVRKFACK